jgi:hypothetical protein
VIGNNKEREEITARRHKILTWKTLSNKKVKTMGVSQENFTISEEFTNTVGYLMIRLTLAGGL